MYKRILPCLLIAGYHTSTLAEDQTHPRDLPAVTITQKQSRESIVPTHNDLKKSLATTPGGTNLITPTQIPGSKYTLRDILDYQPGITMLDFFGGADQPIISIRGSGIQSRPLSRGVMLLENGIPLNDADGSFIIGMLESRDAGLIGVRRGANAINPASDTLGGELDFYNLTGQEENNSVAIQHGSFNTTVGRAAIGRAYDNSDFHISVSGSRSDGFRKHSDQERYALRANTGLFITDNFENRTWLSYTDQEFDIPGPLTRYNVNHHPSTVTDNMMPMVSTTDPYRRTRQWRIANRSLLKSDNLTHDLSVHAQKTDDLFVNPTTRKNNDIRTYGAQYKLGIAQETLDYGLALAWAHSSMDLGYRANPKNPMAAIQTLEPTDYDATAKNLSTQLYANWQFTPQWQLASQLRWVHTKRDIDQKRSTVSHNDSWDWLAPKLGLIWTPSQQQTFFANVSTTREAPTIEQMVQFRSPPPPPARMQLVDIEPQRAVSYEIGGRGKLTQSTDWDMTLYHSIIKKELIEYSPDGITTHTYNYDGKTRHQGIELGLTGNWLLPANWGSRIDGRLSYNYNNFKFRDGDYSGNRIAGIPRHMLSAMVTYHVGAWQMGINSRSTFGSTPTDHSNTQHYGGYTIFGARINYQASQSLSFFLQGDNLTDKRYISSTSVPSTASANGAYYFPGNGRSVMLGLNYTL